MLSLGRTYKRQDEKIVREFYEEGGFEFVRDLEEIHHGCASICETPLFSLTRDISEGKPNGECIREQIDESTAIAKKSQQTSFFGALACLVSLLWTIPLFSGLTPKDQPPQELEMPLEENAGFENPIAI